MSASRVMLLAAMLVVASALADDETLPDREFLEYLGLWQESDEEWLLFGGPDEQQVGMGEEQQKEEPVETEDES